MDILFNVEISGSILPRSDRHKLAGTVTVGGLPAKRVIVVIDKETYLVVAVTLSDATTGAWEIRGLPEYPLESLLVLSIDPNKETNASVADLISQVTE